MAITLIEGFDTYNGTGGATATTVGAGVRWVIGSTSQVTLSNTVIPYNSGQSLVFSNGTTTRQAYIGVTTASAGTLGFAYYTSVLPNVALDIAGFFLNAAVPASRQLAIGVTSTGALFLGTGNSTNGTSVYTTTNKLTSAAWNYIECEFTVSNTVGTVNFYVNGALFGSATGLDTQTQAGSTFNILQLGTFDNGGGATSYFDNLYLTDTASRLGEQRVVTVVPTSDGTPSQWAASGGAVPPYTMVDEVLCNADVDYIFDGTANDQAVFNMASTGATPLSVSAVQIGTFSRKTDTGSRAIQLEYVDSGGTAYSSSDITLASSYQRQLNVLETNPSTATAWTPAEANALKTGVKVSV